MSDAICGCGDHASNEHGVCGVCVMFLKRQTDRVIELLLQYGITEPDTLKHRLEDWDRWRRDILGRSVGD